MKTEPRLMPADFPAYVRGRKAREVKAHYVIGSDTYERWLKEAGLWDQRPRSTRELRAIPLDFAEHAIAETDTMLMARYSAARVTVRTWRAELDVPKPDIPPAYLRRRPMPEGFAEVAPNCTQAQLEERYRAGSQTLQRWFAEANVKPKRGRSGRTPRILRAPSADISVVGQAAAYLRRFYTPVFRAAVLPINERRLLPHRGQDHFVVGSKGALPASEVIALAERRGFDRHAWARI